MKPLVTLKKWNINKCCPQVSHKPRQLFYNDNVEVVLMFSPNASENLPRISKVKAKLNKAVVLRVSSCDLPPCHSRYFKDFDHDCDFWHRHGLQIYQHPCKFLTKKLVPEQTLKWQLHSLALQPKLWSSMDDANLEIRRLPREWGSSGESGVGSGRPHCTHRLCTEIFAFGTGGTCSQWIFIYLVYFSLV